MTRWLLCWNNKALVDLGITIHFWDTWIIALSVKRIINEQKEEADSYADFENLGEIWYMSCQSVCASVIHTEQPFALSHCWSFVSSVNLKICFRDDEMVSYENIPQRWFNNGKSGTRKVNHTRFLISQASYMLELSIYSEVNLICICSLMEFPMLYTGKSKGPVTL